MKRFVLLTLVGLFFVGCSAEFQPEDMENGAGVSDAFSVSEAKSMFESSVSEIDEVTDGFLNPGDFTPRWSEARYTKVSGREYYDVPILPTYKYKVLNSSFVRGRSVVSRDEVYQKLVVMKSSSSASGVYVVSLIPSANNKALLSNLRTGRVKGSSYSGLLVYTDVATGRTVRVDEHESGRRIYGVYVPAVYDDEAVMSDLKSRINSRTLYRSVTLLTRSDGEFDGGEIDPSYCYPEPDPVPDPDPYESPYGEEEPPADPEPDEDFTGEGQEPVNQGTSGTTTPVNPPTGNSLGTEYSPKSTDKFARPNIPSTTDSQMAGWCVYATMSYIAKILGAHYSQSDYALWYARESNNMEVLTGVNSPDVGNLINSCFNAESCSDRSAIIGALDSGEVVFIYVQVSDGEGHALCIVGYAADGTFIYMDPETGTLYNENTDNPLNIVNGYAISGYKEL